MILIILHVLVMLAIWSVLAALTIAVYYGVAVTVQRREARRRQWRASRRTGR